MKKLLSAMSLVLGLGLATAQQTVPATTAPVPPKVAAHHTKAPAKAATMTPAKEAKPAAAPTAVKLKKDGTPDKRYKNSQHLKKDGTPDKRYKANK